MPVPTVELVYDGDCPNSGEARAHLLSAFARAGMTPRWREWRADDPDAPVHVRGFGSPTVLIDGKDVAGALPTEGTRTCRLYADGDGPPRGAPPIDLIVTALKEGSVGRPARHRSGGWKRSMAILPAVGVALLPKVACPACWPAYAGILSAVGLSFLLETSILLPLTAVFLATAVGSLAFRASRRRGYGPFAVGLAGAATVLIGKFVFESDAAMYGGLGVLVAASLWNGWPPKQAAAACTACVPRATSSNET
jgi:mercuric ion transport protein